MAQDITFQIIMKKSNTPKEAGDKPATNEHESDKSSSENGGQQPDDADEKDVNLLDIGLSDFQLYQILNAGGRVTRGTVRKEEPQAPQVPTQKMSRTVSRVSKAKKEPKPPGEKGKRGRKKADASVPKAIGLEALPDAPGKLGKTQSQLQPQTEKPVQRKAAVKKVRAPKKVPTTQPEPTTPQVVPMPAPPLKIIAPKPEPQVNTPASIITPQPDSGQRKRAPSPSGLEQAKLNRSLQVRETYEQHFPHYAYVANRRVLYGDSHALVVSLDKVPQRVDYDKLTAQVQILDDSPPIQMPVRHLKYIGRPFICDVAAIDAKNLSDEVQDSLSSLTAGKLILAQVVDNSLRETDTEWGLNFQVLGWEDDQIKLSGPVRFLNQLTKPEEVQILEDTLKRPGNLEDFSALQAKFDLLRDLKSFDEKVKLSYKDSHVKYIRDFAKELEYRFNTFKSGSGNVIVTEENTPHVLLTRCTFDNHQGRRCKGVLLQSKKLDNGAQWLLFRHIQMKQPLPRKLEWVPLLADQPCEFVPRPVAEGQTQFPHVVSEIFRGFVALDYLMGLDNRSKLGVKLRSRNLVMVSHETHLKEMSQFGTAEPKEDPRMICQHCGKSYPKDTFEPHMARAQRGQTKWRCPSCIRCSQCRSHAASELMLTCRGCSQTVHLDCLHPSERESIPPQLIRLHETILNDMAANKNVTPRLEQFAKIPYRCKECVHCIECGKTNATKWSMDFNFCSSCDRTRQKTTFCLVCYEVDGQGPKQTCSECHRWVHNKCDLVLNGITQSESKQAFSCHECRVSKRIRHQRNLTDQLGNEDKKRFFFPSFWEQFADDARAAYLRQVKQRPFSFDLINERIAVGHYLDHAHGGRQLRVDLYQMFINAKQQNKASSLVHKDAVRLSSSCLTFFKQWEPLLDRLNRTARLETLWIRDIRSKPGWRYGRLVPDATLRPLTDAERLELSKVTEVGQYFITEEHGANEIITAPVAVAEDEKAKVGSKRRREDRDHSDATSNSALGHLNRSVLSKQQKSPKERKDPYAEISAPAELEMKPQPFTGQLPLARMGDEQVEPPAIFQRADEIVEEPRSKRQRLTDYVEPQVESLGRLDPEDEEMSVSAKGTEHAVSQKAGLTYNPNMLAGGVKEKVRRRIIDHYRNEDDEHCYYTNPIRCSFDDPMLIFEEMCYLCGSFGSKEDFIMCKLCGESFHAYCLAENASELESKVLDQSSWCCLNCKSCEICGKATDEKHLYFCGACDRPYHSFCLTPAIEVFPENWKCDLCFSCKLCGASSFFSEEDQAAGLTLQDVDTEASKSFSLCYQCSKDEGRKQNCSICLEKTKPEQNTALETLKCRECGNYSHLTCSRTNVAQLKDLFDEYLAELRSQGKHEQVHELMGQDTLSQLQSVYKCLDCIVQGRSINFLILESCKHYENINAIIKKHKFVTDLCISMLVQYFPQEYRGNVPRIIKKFASENSEFFRTDDVICKWVDLMETTTVASESFHRQNEQNELTYQEPEQTQPSQRWNGYNPFEPGQMEIDTDNVNYKYTAHKASMVPMPRNMYTSIYTETPAMQWAPSDLNRFAMQQSGKLMTSEEIFDTLYSTTEQQKKLESRLVDGIADDEPLSGSDSEDGANFDELCVDYECKMTVRIKEKFFTWFENFYEKTAAVFLGQQAQTSALPEVAEKFSQESTQQYVMDVPVQNCQQSLSCLLCKRKGEYSVTGRLIPYRLNMFVHTNCAFWTQGVFEIDDGQLVNFYHQQAKLQSQKCCYCNELGATMVCSRNLKNCQKYCHFPCAYQSGRIRLTKNKEFVCEQCNKEDMSQVLFPKDVYRKRRLHIIQNNAIILQADYEKEQEELKRGNEIMSRASRKSREIASSVQTRTPEVDQDKWRPFYQDLFNRVGNLTVLSLTHTANQMIDVIGRKEDSNFATIDDYIKHCISNDKIQMVKGSLQDELARNLENHNDYAAIRIYWKQYRDEAMTIPAESAKEARYMERGYFLYLSKNQSIIEVSQSDLKAVLDHCATQIKTNPIVQNRIQTQLKEVEARQIVKAGPPIIQDRFWKKVMQHFKRVNPNFCLQNIEFCFEKLFGLAKYPINVWNNLQIQPADLRASTHVQLQTLQNRSQFFIRAAVPILHSQSMQQAGYSYPYSLVEGLPGLQRNPIQGDLKSLLTNRQLTLDGVFQRMVKVNNMEKYDQDKIVNGFRSSSTNMPTGISSGRRNRLGQFAVNNLSSRHMAYQQLMVASGLGKKVDIGKCIQILTDQKLDKASLKVKKALENQSVSNKSGENDADADSEHEDINTFMRRIKKHSQKVMESKLTLKQIVQHQGPAEKAMDDQGSCNQTASKQVSQSNLPMAMQYRQAMAMPRKVEVGPSKIHRIGLFTCEDLKQNDIVIEYVGEIINNEMADIREEQYKQRGFGDCYMFRIDDMQIIDATFYGGKARYLNHSCDSNCSAKIITVDGTKHIVIRAKRNIPGGSELTYNYNFDQEEDKLGCYCGAKNCQGILA